MYSTGRIDSDRFAQRRNKKDKYKSIKKGKLSRGSFHIETNSRFFVKEAIGCERGNQVHNKVMYGTVTSMFHLANIFQFVINCLDNRAFSKYYSIIKIHQTIFHCRTSRGNDFDAFYRHRAAFYVFLNS